MENSYRDTAVFSEEAKQLKQFLLELESGHESQTVLHEVERFLFDPENRWRLKQDDISRRPLIRPVSTRRHRMQGLPPPLLSDKAWLPLFLLFVSGDSL